MSEKQAKRFQVQHERCLLPRLLEDCDPSSCRTGPGMASVPQVDRGVCTAFHKALKTSYVARVKKAGWGL